MMHRIAGTLVVLVLLLVGTILYFVIGDWFEESPLSYRVPFHVQTPIVHPGGIALVDLYRCNNDTTTRYYYVTRELKSMDGGKGIALPGYGISMEPGCTTLVGLPVPIPVYAKPGIYVDSGISYIEGRRKHFAIPWVSEPITVVP